MRERERERERKCIHSSLSQVMGQLVSSPGRCHPNVILEFTVSPIVAFHVIATVLSS